MLQYSRLTRKPLAAVHQNTSLMFQFIMAEYIHGSRFIEMISSLNADTHSGSTKTLKSSLEALSGSLHEYMRFISWRLEEGILAKLKFHTALFAADATHLHSKRLQLEKTTNQAWKIGLESLDILHRIEERKEDFVLYENLHQKLNLLSITFRKLGKLLEELILEFSLDENVLFFVLRYREKFDAIHGEGFVKKLFTRMYPNGIAEAEKFLREKYQQRGFHNLLIVIDSKFTELANPCYVESN